jgi:hypothetical protein
MHRDSWAKVYNFIWEIPVNENIFMTRFGQDLTDDVIRWDFEGKGQDVVNPSKGKLKSKKG